MWVGWVVGLTDFFYFFSSKWKKGFFVTLILSHLILCKPQRNGLIFCYFQAESFFLESVLSLFYWFYGRISACFEIVTNFSFLWIRHSLWGWINKFVFLLGIKQYLQGWINKFVSFSWIIQFYKNRSISLYLLMDYSLFTRVYQ